MSRGRWPSADLHRPTVLAACGAVAAGARAVGGGWTWIVVAGVVAAGLLDGVRVMVILAVVCALVGWRAGVAEDGLTLAPGPVEGEVRLRSDPVARDFTVEAVVTWGRHRVLLVTGRVDSLSWRGRPVGTKLEVVGRVRPLERTAWTRSMHLAGRLTARIVVPGGPPAGGEAAVDWARSVVLAGISGVEPPWRALVSGMVIGDDRDLDVVTEVRFLRAGLSHLLVVSGQNLSLVLVAAVLAVRRWGRWVRFGAVVGVSAWFVAVVRPEPSILRAAAMAGVGAAAFAVGRPLGGVETVLTAVTVLVIADPLIVYAAGFWLSTAATLGLVVGSLPIARRLSPRCRRGRAAGREPPGPVALALGATVAAQVGVAPVLLVLGGDLGLVGLPANLLAAPAATGLTVWGCLVAPLLALGGPLGVSAAALPATWAARWVDAVARVAASTDLPRLGWIGFAAGCAVAGLWALTRGRPRSTIARRVGVLAALLAACPPGWGPGAGRGVGSVRDVPGGCVVHRDGVTVLVVGKATPERLLPRLERLGIRRVDEVRSATAPALGLLEDVSALLEPRRWRVDAGVACAR